MAEAAEAGQGLLIGAVATGPAARGPLDRGRLSPREPPARGVSTPTTARPGPATPLTGSSGLYQRLGLPLDTLAAQAVITPACGLAGASPAQARAALTRCREAASMVPELIEETGDESR